MIRWILSPILVYECVLGARRWQTYAGRTAFLVALLASLAVVWVIRVPGDRSELSRNALAGLGAAFFFAIAGTQLVLVLLVAPAYTAASICLDKARGTLAHLLVTDLSAAEIVLGKLGARGVLVFSLLVAGVPVMVLATLLGGTEPEAVLGSVCVTLAAALVVCATALALSVWGTKPHEVLLATYVFEAAWLLAWPLWHELNLQGLLGAPPNWLKVMNPFALVFGPYAWSERVTFSDYALFVGASAGLSAALTLFAILTLRRAALRDGARRAPRRRFPRLIPFGPALDFNPVLWREWRRPLSSRWLQVIWGLYAIVSLGVSATAFFTRHRGGGDMAAFVNAFQFSIGLLLVSITSVASLFEERVNGSLGLLMATPLSTSSIVWGKWLASFRVVALVMLLPALLASSLLLDQRDPGRGGDLLVLLIALMFAYGALINSFGLALATWVSRFGVAMGLTVAVYVLLAAGPVLLLLAAGMGDRESMRGFASLSPWYGVGETTAQMIHSGPPSENIGGKILWLILYGAAAFALLLATQGTFDRCIGRARSRP